MVSTCSFCLTIWANPFNESIRKKTNTFLTVILIFFFCKNEPIFIPNLSTLGNREMEVQRFRVQRFGDQKFRVPRFRIQGFRIQGFRVQGS